LSIGFLELTIPCSRFGTKEATKDDAIDSNEIEIVDVPAAKVSTASKLTPQAVLRKSMATCCGILLTFPAGKNEHISYPFGLHNERPLPWNYQSIDDKFFLRAKSCLGAFVEVEQACPACEGLKSNAVCQGIIERIERGMNENISFAYQPVGGLVSLLRRRVDQVQALRLTKLNDTRKLVGKAAALEDHKQWILAVASGKVDRVAALVQAGLKNNVGIRGLIAEYERAALKLYRPRGYTEEDMMRSIVMLRLGGVRVAEFAHRSMSLPSPRTARRNTVIRPLVVSSSTPTVDEVESNIISCLEALDVEDEQGPRRHTRIIMHQVLMLDEIATEKRARWDDKTNMFMGSCREHNHKVPLEFSTEKELNIFCDALDNGDIHLASEVRILISMMRIFFWLINTIIGYYRRIRVTLRSASRI
jgi:hypothetical protein